MMAHGRYHSVAKDDSQEKNVQRTSFESASISVEDNYQANRSIRNVKLLLITCSVCLILGAVFYHKNTHAANHWCPNITWADEFDGTSLDTSKWSYQNGDGCDIGLCGWGNKELEFYAEDNLRITNGSLIIEARKEFEGSYHSYTSSKILTRDKASFGPMGRFEARIQLPQGQGIWPAFWMLPADDIYGGWPNSGEIDIMENIGKEGSNTVHGTIHYGLDWPKDQYNEEGIFLPPNQWGNFSSSFHVFAVEREAGLIRWLVDDIVYSTKTKMDVIPYLWPFDETFYFILNLAVGGTWPGDPDDSTTFPQQMIIDYVRVYNGTFPRIEGRDHVDSFETHVVYRIIDGQENEFGKKVDNAKLFYKWTVPDGATIGKGQGTPQIFVNFGKKSGIVSVELHVNNEKGEYVSFCDSHIKNKMGIRINVVNSTLFDTYHFDCGCPSSCTQEVLNRDAAGHTCGQRIQWLMEDGNKKERAACMQVSYIEHNGICGPCYPNCDE